MTIPYRFCIKNLGMVCTTPRFFVLLAPAALQHRTAGVPPAISLAAQETGQAPLLFEVNIAWYPDYNKQTQVFAA